MGRDSINPNDKKAERNMKTKQDKADKKVTSEAEKVEKVRIRLANKGKKSSKSRKTLFFYLILLSVLWTGVVLFFYMLNKQDVANQLDRSAIKQASVAAAKDAAYYQWVLSQDKLYRLGDNRVSSDGSPESEPVKKMLIPLTADEILSKSQSAWKQETDSLIQVIYAETLPQLNEWERTVFHQLESGKDSSSAEKTTVAGQYVIRAMHPINVAIACTNCDVNDKTTASKVIAAIVLTYPMTAETQLLSALDTQLMYRYAAIWLIGLVLFLIGGVHLYLNFGAWDEEERILQRRIDEQSQVLNMRTQEVLRLQQNQKQFIENIDAAVYMRNRDNVFTMSNERFVSAIGARTEDDIVGTNGEQYLDVYLADYLHQHEEMAVRHEQAVETGYFDLLKEGLVRGVIFPTRGLYGQIDGVAAIFMPANTVQNVAEREESVSTDDKLNKRTRLIPNIQINSAEEKLNRTQGFFSTTENEKYEIEDNRNVASLLDENNPLSYKQDSEHHELDSDFKELSGKNGESYNYQQSVDPMAEFKPKIAKEINKSDLEHREQTKPTTVDDKGFVFDRNRQTASTVKDDDFTSGLSGSQSKPITSDDGFAFGSSSQKAPTVKDDDFILGQSSQTKPSTGDDDGFIFGSSSNQKAPTVKDDDFILGQSSQTKPSTGDDDGFIFGSSSNQKAPTVKDDDFILGQSSQTKPSTGDDDGFIFGSSSNQKAPTVKDDDFILGQSSQTKPSTGDDDGFIFGSSSNQKAPTVKDDDFILGQSSQTKPSTGDDDGFIFGGSSNQKAPTVKDDDFILGQSSQTKPSTGDDDGFIFGSSSNQKAPTVKDDDFILGQSSQTKPSTGDDDGFIFGSSSNQKASTVKDDDFILGQSSQTKPSTGDDDGFIFGSSSNQKASTVKDDDFILGQSSSQLKPSDGVETVQNIEPVITSYTGQQPSDEFKHSDLNEATESIQVVESTPVKTYKSKTRLNILLVDDSEEERNQITEVLQSLGHLVNVAQDGYQAVEMQGWGTFDAVLMDIQMPVMNGIQATAHIRKQERLNKQAIRIPIIALVNTGSMTGDLDTYRSCGMDNYIIKPVQLESAWKVLETIIDEFHLVGVSSPEDTTGQV